MKINKKYLYIGGAVLVVLIVLLTVFIGKGKSSNSTQGANSLPTQEVIPTIDSSVKVDFSVSSDKHWVTLAVQNIPQTTTSLDYELSYETGSKGLQGVIGNADVTGKDSLEKKIALGTASSGVYTWHDVVGNIKLTLRFTGDYGQKVFEKEYGL